MNIKHIIKILTFATFKLQYNIFGCVNTIISDTLEQMKWEKNQKTK